VGGCRGRKGKGERQVGPTGGSWDGGEIIRACLGNGGFKWMEED
jgi:hypothetical protein